MLKGWFSVIAVYIDFVGAIIMVNVSHFQILKLLTNYGPVLGVPHVKFRCVVLKLKDIDFDLDSSYFFWLIIIVTYCYMHVWY